MAPLSAGRADRLAADLAAAKPSTVADLGCGWGELLLRVIASCPDAEGIGLDVHGPDLVRARDNATARGLSQRVTFVNQPAADHRTTADIVICVGAYHAFGSSAEALSSLRDLGQPGWNPVVRCRVLSTAADGAAAGEHVARHHRRGPHTDLPVLVDQAVDAGFRPLRIETATRDEWAEFESRFAAEREAWLLRHADHPDADAVREALDTQRNIWLRGHRGGMGFAYLTLGR